MKNKLVVLMVLVFCLTFGTATIGMAGASTIDMYAVENEVVKENVEKITITKEKVGIFEDKSNYETKYDLINKYGDVISEDKINSTEHIVIQKQNIQPRSDYNASSTWNDSEGYITLYTSAYYKNSDGPNHKRYLIEAMVQYNKTFKRKQSDSLGLSHSFGSTYITGTSYGEKEGNSLVTVTPSYSGIYGIVIRYKYSSDLTNAIARYEISVKNGEYATIQSCYVHSESIFSDNVTLSFSNFLGISISGGSYTEYRAEQLSFLALS